MRPRPAALTLALSAVVAALALLTATAASGATPSATSAPQATPAAATTTTPSGIQVGPTPPAPPTPYGPPAPVNGDTPSHAAFWDLPGQVRDAIDNWFKGLVLDALNPMLQLVGETVLSTPSLASNAQIVGLWQISLIAADSLLVLFVMVAAGLAMSHDTMQTQYAVKDLVRRLAFAGIVINASLSLVDQIITVSNALAAAFLSDGASAAAAGASLQNFVVAALSGGGIFLILLGLGCAVAAVALMVLYVLRAAIVIILVCAAPVVLLCHLFPQTEGVAHLWWRAISAAFIVQVAQALVLATCVQVFFASDGSSTLGLSVGGSVIDLLLCLCLLFVLVRIPFWAKQAVFGSRGTSTLRMVKAYVTARAIGSVIGR